MRELKFALSNRSNFKDVNVMATRKLTHEVLQAVTRLAKRWGKIIVKLAFGAKAPGPDVAFAQMGEVAGAAARGLTAGALETATTPGNEGVLGICCRLIALPPALP